MRRRDIRQLKPFLSVVLIIGSFFTVMLLQMEERRMGYSVLKLTREYKKVQEEKRNKEIALAKVTRPQLLDKVAQSKFTLKKLQPNQIIHLSGQFEKVEKPLIAKKDL